MRAYSTDLRQRVLAACDAGHSNAAVAQTFSVSQSWIRRIKQVRRATGRVAPKAQSRRGPRPGWETHADAIRQARPGDTVQVLAGTYKERFVIDKPLHLEGVGKPTIAAGHQGDVAYLEADTELIEEFCVENEKSYERMLRSRQFDK